MVTFKTKMDSTGRIYIARPIRESGLVNNIEILPNAKAAIIYRAGTKISDILASLEIIVADLKHRAQVETEKQ